MASTTPSLHHGQLQLSDHGDIQDVKPIISGLLKFISEVKHSLPEPEPQSADGAVAPEEKKIEAKEDGGGGGKTISCCGGVLAGDDKKGVGSKEAESVPDGGSGKPSGTNGGGGAGGGDSEGGANGSASASSSSGGSNDALRNQAEKLRNQAEKLRRDLNYIERALIKFSDLEAGFCRQFKDIDKQRLLLDQILTSMAQVQRNTSAISSQQVDKFRSISDMVTHLKLQIPSLSKLSASNTGAHKADEGFVFDAYCIVGETPREHMMKEVLGASAFKEFFNDLSCVFEGLDRRSKLCLLCFSVFPENALLRKRLLVNWWIGEGLVDPGEESVDEIFKEFIAKGFVEPVLKKRKVIGFKMDPLVRFVVIDMAKKIGFFSFNSMGVPTEEFLRSYRACLVRSEGESSRESLTKSEADLDKLRTIFNVNDPYPDFKLDWFSKLENLDVLYLGSWQDFAKHHIEVEDLEFLKGLKHMKHLQFLSLQGISRITELPDSICKLISLKILDLNACHNLELLPKNIGALKKLTHLDISQCYLLDHIPKELSSLTQLQVLKGFVISDVISSDFCAFTDLKYLPELRKLSIYTGNVKFPTDNELEVLQGFENLEKLTIEWGGKPNSTKTPQDNISAQPNETHQPAQTASAVGRKLSKKFTFKRSTTRTSSLNAGDARNLQKLELHCFPGTTAPSWLIEGKLKPQKSLYISGGHLQTLIQNKRITWSVKILCLKFLSELKMDWGDLQKSFPELIYLEKVRCPKLTLFPCDEHGVWLKGKMEGKQMAEPELSLSWSFLKRKDTTYPIPISSSPSK